MLQFPSEIHGMIAEKCTQKDIASVARVCKQLYQTYQSYLYKVNIKFHESSAFWRIFRCCKPDVAVKALQNAINAGADIQHSIQHEVSFYHNNYKPLDLFTPLHMAVWNGNPSSVTCLIQNGADLNNQSCSFDLTPLMLALLRGREAIALNLLDHGAALTTSKFGDTPLHLAAERNFLDVIKYLVQNRGMDSNCQNSWGYTPLLCAVDSIYAKKEVIAYLCVHGADPTYSTTSAEHILPLQKAIENSSWGIAEQLVRDGVDPSEIPIPLARRLADAHTLRTDGLQEFLAFIDSLENATDIYTDTFDRLISQTDEYCRGAELLLRKGCIEISNRTSRWMSRAMSPSSGSSTTTALLLQYGARIPDFELGKILRLINQILRCYNKRLEERVRPLTHLAPIFQVLLHHYSGLELEHQHPKIARFLAGCPDWVMSLVISKPLHCLTVKDLRGPKRMTRGVSKAVRGYKGIASEVGRRLQENNL